MTFGLHRRISESSATYFYRKVKSATKNALDMELIKEARQVVFEDMHADYYIISQDKDYKTFILNCINHGINIALFPTISETNKDKKDKLTNTLRFRLVYDKKNPTYNLDDDEIGRMACMLMQSETKTELNQNLQTMFYNKDVKYIFSRIKDITYNL